MKDRILRILEKDAPKISLLGLGKSNIGIMKFILGKSPNARFTLRCERCLRQNIPDKVVKVYTGGDFLAEIDEDAIFLSPSARRERPELSEAMARGTLISSDAEAFFAFAERPVLAVTGSDGKSTTVKMAEAILSAEGAAIACGNIGLPFVSVLEREVDFYVSELSSFTLEYLSPRSRRALITNISENHLDWHGDYADYVRAKENILRFADECVLSPDTKDCMPLIKKHRPWGLFSSERSFAELSSEYPFADKYFTAEEGFLSVNGERIVSVSSLSKKEPHNVKNALAAIALTHGFCNTGAAVSALESFSGLPHRMETAAVIGGVKYIDSSIDSTPERTAATLRAMPEKLTVLLGGRGKGLSYLPLIEPLCKKHGRIIISGENRYEILSALSAAECLTERISVTETLRDAVDTAMREAKSGETVLLSPASTSYDAFRNFEERGEAFKEYIKQGLS